MATGEVDVEETPASGAVTLNRSRTRRGSRDGTASSSSVTDLSGSVVSGTGNGVFKCQSEGEGGGAGDGSLDNNVDGTGEINGYAEATDRNKETLPSLDLLFSKPSKSGTEERLVSNSIVLGDEDIEELDLERIVEDSEAYDFYCPKCNCCLKKVVVHKKEQASRDDVFRCSSCLSFLFFAAGRRFCSPFSPDPDPIGRDPGNSPGQDLPGDDSAGHNLSAAGEVKSDGNVHHSSVHGSSSETQEPQKDELKDAKEKDSGLTANSPSDRTHHSTHPVSVATKLMLDYIDHRDPTEIPRLLRPSQAPSTAATQIPDVVQSRPTAGTVSRDPNDVGILVDSPSEGATQEPNTDNSEGSDVLKSIIYGGLVETITSLGVVTSAVAANSNTANIAALSAANLVGGLVVLGHCLWELKTDGPRRISHQSTEQQVNQYQELLGRRDNFPLHATASVLSFLVFGVVPLLTYAFSFGKSNERELKLAAAMAISLFCVIVLAAGKAHTQNQQHRVGQYVKTILYYVCTGVAVSGLSYIVGALIMKLIDKLGWFKAGEVVQLGGDLQLFSPL